jgi:hypothetical protein
MIRLIVHTDRGIEELDTYGNENINITYAIDDLRNIESKAGDYSKIFDLPATKNNNRYFGYLHDLQSDVTQYNTLVGHRCELSINGIQVFEGLLYLNEIVKLDNETKYKVNLLGESIRLLEVLGDATLSDLDFTDLSHDFTNANIDNSGTVGVTTTSGSVTTGVYYSLIQNLGVVNSSGNLTITSTKNYQPFVRLKSIVDKIFEFARMEYDSDFFDVGLFDDIYMDTGLNDDTIEGTHSLAHRRMGITAPATVSTPNIDYLYEGNYQIYHTNFVANSTSFTTIFQNISDNFTFENIHDITTSYTKLDFGVEPTTYNGVDNDTGNIMGAAGKVTIPTDNFSLDVELRLQIYATQGETITLAYQLNGSSYVELDTFTMPNITNTPFGLAYAATPQQIVYKNWVINENITLDAGDEIEWFIKKSGGDAWVSRYRYEWYNLDNTGNTNPNITPAFTPCTDHYASANTEPKLWWGPVGATVTNNFANRKLCVSYEKSTTYQGNYVTVTPTNLVPDAIQHRIHTNHGDVKLADILKDIIKMFNLVIENRNGILKIEPYNSFITSGNSRDWSSKIDTTEILQNYERVPSQITWRYNNDADDAKLNEYLTKTGEEYGSMTIDLPVDYVDKKEIKLDVFSATAFTRLYVGARYSNCFSFQDGVYENFENNPRLIFKNEAVVNTGITDDTGIYTEQKYRAGSHFQDYPSDLISTDHSLNFGYTQSLFLSVGFTTPINLYNGFWFDYINERYTAERVLVKCKAYLNETDIQTFSFADTITVQNQQYRVVKIEYSAGQSGLAKLEMIKL